MKGEEITTPTPTATGLVERIPFDGKFLIYLTIDS